MVHDESIEVVAVNYWKGVKKEEIGKELLSRWGTLLLIHNSIEFQEITYFLSQLPHSKRMIYISLTKGYDALKPDLDGLKTKLNAYNTQILVVDCVTKTVFDRKSTKECYFEYPPANLRAIVILINKYLRHFNPEYIILDSLSQYIDFSGSIGREMYGFLNYLKNQRSRTVCKFILLYDDYLSKELKSIPEFFIDKVIKLEVIKDKVYWKD